MRIPLTWLLFVALVGSLGGCSVEFVRGEGDVVVERPDLGGFDAVEVCCGMHLHAAQGANAGLEIEAHENIQALIRVEERDGTVVVGLEPDRPVSFDAPVIVRATAPEFTALSASGGGRVSADGLDVEGLVLQLSGGGRARVTDFTAGQIDVSLSGGSEARVAGVVQAQTVEASGGSEYDAGDLRSVDGGLVLSGGSRATVHVSKELDIHASGGSRAIYYGDPVVSSDVSGGSEIEVREPGADQEGEGE